jgi:heat shock protein HslJ
MKKIHLVLVLLTLAALLLAACGAPPAPPAPTAGPEQVTPATQPDQPAQPPTAVPQVQPPATAPLTGKVWQWTKTIYNDGKTIEVPTPASYTIEFMPDGKVVIKADCNNVLGTYLTEDNSVTITLGPSTMAMCPEGSLDSEYLKQLGEVSQYLIQGETLILNFKLDGGGMTFSSAPSAQAQPGQPGEIPGQDLGGKTWQWVNSAMQDGQTFAPTAPADYTIEFSMVDGRVNVKADCNNAIGEFMTDGQSLQIMLGAVTRAMCGPDSLSDQFLKQLSEVNAYAVQGDTLTLTTANGTMTLMAGQAAGPSGSQQPSTAGQPAPLEGPTWNWIKTEYSNDTTITAPDPAKFTVTFDQATRRFNFTADCNNGSGSYTLSGSSLTMQTEGMTLAFCPLPNGDFTQMLNQVASYKIEGSTLFLAFKMDGGIMTFTTGGAQPAPGTGTTTTPPTASTGSNVQRLQTGVWKWQQSADNSGQMWNSPNPANYTIQFNPDGTLGLKLDCNTGGGSYQADETNLTIQLGFSTLMACPPPTLDTEFSRQLSLVSSYMFDGNDLILLWKMDAGSMKFSQ